jgi:phospholipase/carboxylesterase
VPTQTEPQSLTFSGWTFRLRPASSNNSHLFLLLHGWKGDENSMGIFTRNLPERYTILAPRAPYPDPTGGFTWRKIVPGKWDFPSLDDLRPAAEALIRFVDDWSASANVDAAQFTVAGFSQGAALTYTLALLYPERIRTFAALSGFLPAGSEALLRASRGVRLDARVLEGKRVFVAHGRQDDMVPVERARSAVALLEASGVEVDYCESDSGHKVGKDCVRGMGSFFG